MRSPEELLKVKYQDLTSEEHAEKKICPRCKNIINISEISSIALKRRDYTCKQCKSDYNKKYRQLNKDRVSNNAKLARQKYKNLLNEYLIECCVCGQNNKLVLEFHHIDDKEKEHTIGLMREFSTSKIVNEIEKCIVLCRNCHHLYHQQDRFIKAYLSTKDKSNWYYKNLFQYKINKSQICYRKCCQKCGELNYNLFDFHHIESNLKKFGITDRLHNINIDDVLDEINKCVVLCKNCHMIYHTIYGIVGNKETLNKFLNKGENDEELRRVN